MEYSTHSNHPTDFYMRFDILEVLSSPGRYILLRCRTDMNPPAIAYDRFSVHIGPKSRLVQPPGATIMVNRSDSPCWMINLGN